MVQTICEVLGGGECMVQTIGEVLVWVWVTLTDHIIGEVLGTDHR